MPPKSIAIPRTRETEPANVNPIEELGQGLPETTDNDPDRHRDAESGPVGGIPKKAISDSTGKHPPAPMAIVPEPAPVIP